MYYTKYGGNAPARSGAAHASIAPYGPFATGDGGRVLLGIQNGREWERFCTHVLARPELASDPRFASNADRVRHREALSSEIEGEFGSKRTSEVLLLLDSADIANARLNDVAAFAAHEQLSARGRWAPVDSPAGPIEMLKPPALPDGVDAPMGPIPALGAHTASILAELGIDDSTKAAWREKGLI
jgi:itaconate CoA-transferase